MSKTHDYTQSVWGHACNVLEVIDGGQKLELAGFGYGVKKGDFVILANRQGETTRYKITKIKYTFGVRDMWFANAKFAPRQLAEVQE